MRKTIYESYKPDEFFDYEDFFKFMIEQKGSELVRDKAGQSLTLEIDNHQYQIWNFNGVTVQYSAERMPNGHTQVNLFGTTRKIGEIEKIILAEAEKHKSNS